jgi:prolyl 4-hydroxylase
VDRADIHRPARVVWHGFMSHDERDHVVNTAEPLMEKSGVIDAKTGAETYDPIRTSFGALLPSVVAGGCKR